jgi:hypothetical protein
MSASTTGTYPGHISRSQIFELCHIFIGPVISVNVMVLTCIVVAGYQPPYRLLCASLQARGCLRSDLLLPATGSGSRLGSNPQRPGSYLVAFSRSFRQLLAQYESRLRPLPALSFPTFFNVSIIL